MKYVFAGIGGCGSSHLINLLQKTYTVDSKPDTFFVRNGEPHTPKPGSPHQLLSPDGLRDMPTKASAKAFFKRTSYKLSSSLSIGDNLAKYLESIQSNPKRTAFFNSVAKLKFFSQYRIENVVYLVRNPLDAYISFTKQKRHFNLVEKFGGINAKKSVIYYITAWNDIVLEYLSSPNSIIIRHEHFDSDIKPISPISHFANKWKKFENDKSILNKKTIDLIQTKSESAYRKIYG